MSQKPQTSQDAQDSRDHDLLPESFMSDAYTSDEALKLMVKLGLNVAPDAKQIAENMGNPSKSGSQGRGASRGRNRSWYRGQGRGRGGGDNSQQRQKSMVEELSTISASQSQMKDMSAAITDLGKVSKVNVDAVAKLAARMDGISTRQTKDIANLRQAMASLAGDFGDMKNLLSHMITRGGANTKATYPTMTAGDLATMTLESGKKVTGKEEVTLKGAGVPTKTLRVTGVSHEESVLTPPKNLPSTVDGLKRGILLTKSAPQPPRVSVRPTAATRPPRPSMALLPPKATAQPQRPDISLRMKKTEQVQPPVADIDSCVERFGPTSVREGKMKEAETDLIDFQGSWDDQGGEEEYGYGEDYEGEDYEEDEDDLYGDYPEAEPQDGFTFDAEG